MAWENLDNNACPLLFFWGLFFHRNRSTCRRVRHPWLLDWTVGTRYQKNWETRLFFFRNIGIYFHRRYRVESESEIADWQGETSDPWLLDWIWENWDTTCPRLLFFSGFIFSQSQYVGTMLNLNPTWFARRLAAGWDIDPWLLDWTVKIPRCTLQSKTRLPVGKNLEQKHYLNLGKK